MNLSEKEINLEEMHLEKIITIIRKQISDLGQDLYDDKEKQKEFKKFMWDNKTDLDPTEMKTLMSGNDLEIELLEGKAKYYKKLYKLQNSPYFGAITFNDGESTEKLYIGLGFLQNGINNLIYDWRAPISSLFYDYEIGYAEYKAPGGIIKGQLLNKRQFKIEYGKLLRVFDSNLNIQDELLQEVLSNKTNDKMKNIVNTIQQEQNLIIRNITHKNLIVQGIAGSGKTSVALHRIAFLLYKIPDLTSNDVLIFSPNNVFSEYISNVLPELGEENTKETTFNNFLNSFITEYNSVESFSKFIEKYYKYETKDTSLIKFKQSDEIINCVEEYAERITKEVKFNDGIFNHDIWYTKEELNLMFHEKYKIFPLFERFEYIADKISEQCCKGNKSKTRSIKKWLYEKTNIKNDFKLIYKNFFLSNEFKIKYSNINENSLSNIVNNKEISFEDACLFVYLKGLLNGFWYKGNIKQTIIDEAQDYNKLQYIILKKILKKSKFTILGDINQTINPYYKYNSLNDLNEIIGSDTGYYELLKTYRSSPEIIEHTNKILGLTYISAIRRDNNIPVVFRHENNDLKTLLESDINEISLDNSSIAIITKTDEESKKIFNLLKSTYPNIVHISSESKKFSKDLIVIPSYMAKGLEFDATIVYTLPDNKYKENEKYLYYVSCTRSQHKLIIYNQE